LHDIGILVLRDMAVLSSSIDSYVTGINDAGQAIGNYRVAEHSDGRAGSFITGPNGTHMQGMLDEPSDINNAGQVVNGSGLFIVEPSGGGLTRLAIPGDIGGTAAGSALAINDAGQVVGSSRWAPSTTLLLPALMVQGSAI
jgi:hypothetical protein